MCCYKMMSVWLFESLRKTKWPNLWLSVKHMSWCTDGEISLPNLPSPSSSLCSSEPAGRGGKEGCLSCYSLLLILNVPFLFLMFCSYMHLVHPTAPGRCSDYKRPNPKLWEEAKFWQQFCKSDLFCVKNRKKMEMKNHLKIQLSILGYKYKLI